MKIIEIKGFPLVKFQKKKRIESLQQGLIYMKTLRYYREQEELFNDTVVGDFGEARWHINDATMIVTPVAGGESESGALNDVWFNTIHSDDYVFCLSGVYPFKNKAFEYTQEQKEKISEFGDTALIITDVYEFYRRVLDSAEKSEFITKGNFVYYYDETIDEANRIFSLLLDLRNIAFQKRKKYSYQQEYRFLLTPKIENKSEFIKLNIGNIEDISVIFKTSDLLNSRIEQMGYHTVGDQLYY